MLPPFTDLRSVQTLVDGDKLRHRLRRAGPLGARLRRLHRRDLGGDAGQAGLHLRAGRPHRAPPVPRRDDEGRRAPRSRPPSARARARSCASARAWRSARPATTWRTPWRRSTAPSRASRPSRSRTIVVAYEPVWAIGTGEVATPEDAQEVCAAIRPAHRRALLRRARRRRPCPVRRLGEGVNVAAIMAQPDVDGALVGGASLDADEFVRIVRFHATADRLGRLGAQPVGTERRRRIRSEGIP